jgi:hypothetical protein
MIESEGEVKEDKRKALLAFHGMDTLVMFEIYKRLRDVGAG